MRTAAQLLVVAALALASCSGSRKEAGAGKAEGEILPGSTSDAMLPYDTASSQPPLAPKATPSASDAAEATAADVSEAPEEPEANP